ncbi:MAG: hypothetical protein AAFR79_08435, partial [Pseudomonadota bacterium]
ELDGGSGNDSLEGGDAGDNLDGGAGNDTVDGGDGDDILEDLVGEGADVLTGGAGDDTFVFLGSGNDASRPTEPGPDVITDFNGSGETDPDDENDLIDISDFGVTATLFVSTESGALTVDTAFTTADAGYDGSGVFAVQAGDDTQVIVDSGDTAGTFDQEDVVFLLEDFDADDLDAADFIF